jgi:hypothetical protein
MRRNATRGVILALALAYCSGGTNERLEVLQIRAKADTGKR